MGFGIERSPGSKAPTQPHDTLARMLIQCWSNGYDVRPTSDQHRAIVPTHGSRPASQSGSDGTHLSYARRLQGSGAAACTGTRGVKPVYPPQSRDLRCWRRGGGGRDECPPSPPADLLDQKSPLIISPFDL